MKNYFKGSKGRSLLLMLCALFLLSFQTFAQKETVSGKIVDKSGQPLIGASVVIKGTTRGTVSDASGTFKLSVPGANTVLVFSYIGYITQQTKAGSHLSLNIILQEDEENLHEVIVTALGIKKEKADVGYAVQTLDPKAITRVPDPNLINNLSGKLAGVSITNGGAGVGSTSRIVIRGENSFSGTNQPLFVVDGVPINNETYFNDAIENSSSAGTWAEVDWGNGAAEINPNDIGDITVLKGAAAAALYGSRAANGAVVLTTKKGQKHDGRIGVTVNSTTTFETPLKLPHLQNEYGAGIDAYPLSGSPTTYSYVNGGTSNENNIPNWGLKFDPSLNVLQFDSPVSGTDLQAGDLVQLGINGKTATPSPWIGHADHFKKFLQTGVTTQNNIALSGVSDQGSYHFSMGELYNKGILPGTDLKRYSFSFRGEHHFTPKLTSDVFATFINSSSDNRPNIGYGSESVMYTFFGVYGMPMNININSLKKRWQTGQDQQNQFRYWNNHDNPYVTMHDNVNSFNKRRLIGNASLKYTIDPHWNMMVRTGTDFYLDHREGHRAFTTVRFPTGGFRTDDVSYFENNTDFLLNYRKKKSPVFNVDASIGGNRFLQNVTYTRDVANSLITPGLYNFSNAENQLPTLLDKSKRLMYSIYAFGDFDYKSQLFLNITGRNDRSSTLPKGNNSYFYPSASLSAVVSNMTKLPRAISYLKLRASIAKVGRDADPYSINNTYTTQTPFNDYPLTEGNSTLANSHLKPSSTVTTEFGMEARFLDNRIGVDLAWYNAATKDEIVQLPIPVSSGYTNTYVNGASINNKGFEVVLTATPFRSTDTNHLNWDMTFNFSHNVSKVTALPGGINSYIYAQVTQYDRYYRAIQYVAKVGQRLGNMYGNSFVRDNSGNIVYKDGVPQFTTSQNTLLGNYNPNFILSWSNNLSYKNFNLNFLWDWHQGGKFYSYTELGVLAGGMSNKTLPGRETGIVGKGVMADGNGNYVSNNVRVDAATYYNAYYNATNNEAFMYNASYLKLREVKLGYTFRKIFRQPSITGAYINVSLIARNYLEITQNKDVDPETLALRGQQILPGTEFLSVPSTKSLGFSLSLNF